MSACIPGRCARTILVPALAKSLQVINTMRGNTELLFECRRQMGLYRQRWHRVQQKYRALKREKERSEERITGLHNCLDYTHAKIRSLLRDLDETQAQLGETQTELEDWRNGTRVLRTMYVCRS